MRSPGVEQLTALLSRGGPQLALKSGQGCSRKGGGGCRPSVPPKPFFGSTWPPLMPRPRGLRPDVLKVAPASLPGPIPGHRPLMDRPTEAGSGDRAAPEVLEGPDPGPLRVSPHVHPGGPRDRDLWGSGTTAQKVFLVWPHCPAHSPAPDGKTLVGWAGETPARLALILLQGGRPTLQTLPGYRPHSWVGKQPGPAENLASGLSTRKKMG